MANYTTDPNTGILIPTPGQDPGPDYAVNISNALTKLSSLTHTGASNNDGPLIPTAGLNINADLPINNNDLTGVRSVRFQSQAGTINSAGDIGCSYVNAGNLYFIDGSGNQIKITSGGGLNTTTTTNYSAANLSASTTIASSNTNQFFFVDTTATRTIILPAASAVGSGHFYYFADKSGSAATNNITIQRASSDLIDGMSTLVLSQNYAATGLISDGVSKWKSFGLAPQSTLTFGSTTLSSSGVVAGSNSLASSGLTSSAANIGTLTVTGTSTLNSAVSATSGLTVTGGLSVGGGIVITDSTLPVFQTAVSRSIDFFNGQVMSNTGWTYSGGVTNNYYSASTAANIVFAVPMISGATLSSIDVWFQIGGTRTSGTALPTTQLNAVISKSLIRTSVGAVTYLNSTVVKQVGAATPSAYYGGGTIQSFNVPCNQNNVINAGDFVVLSINSESGTNAVANANYINGFRANYTNVTNISNL